MKRVKHGVCALANCNLQDSLSIQRRPREPEYQGAGRNERGEEDVRDAWIAAVVAVLVVVEEYGDGTAHRCESDDVCEEQQTSTPADILVVASIVGDVLAPHAICNDERERGSDAWDILEEWYRVLVVVALYQERVDPFQGSRGNTKEIVVCQLSRRRMHPRSHPLCFTLEMMPVASADARSLALVLEIRVVRTRSTTRPRIPRR